ncbi:MAG: YhbY family RNA-binding protein [Nanoarchaeota archaeon]
MSNLKFQKEIQLGKKGITNEFIKDIESRLHNYRNVILKISVLKSARENGKDNVRKYAQELIEKLGDKYTVKTLGFSIFLRKWRKSRS